ncbi:MAG: TM2 domain-containing protein [Fibromonadales bacterium]|nr:TM2 domain-containing protein [Fibromonadales bacterium]
MPNANEKNGLTLLLLAGFLGGFGADRFYNGQTGLGIAKLLTAGGCGIWALIDFIMIVLGSYKDKDGNIVQVIHEGVEPKSSVSWSTTMLFSAFLGSLGVDRFFSGRIGLGILKLITLGGLGLWWLIDMILTMLGKTKDAQGKFIAN